MNRIIKFRVWQKTHGYMTTDISMLHYDGEQRFYYTNPQDGILIDDDWALMQFTGLTTEDGTEIYEGDIIISSGELGVVKHGEYAVEYGVYDGGMDAYGWYYEEQNKQQYSLSPYITVIGNIYENPELFKYLLGDY